MPKTENTIKTMFDLLGEDIYNYHGDYTGIIPALINDLNEIDNNRYYLKTVIVDYTYEGAKQKYNDFINRVKTFVKENNL